jgi:hypothetical protein
LNEKGIIVNPAGSKEAVPVVKRTIRVIKERFRSNLLVAICFGYDIYSLPFKIYRAENQYDAKENQ